MKYTINEASFNKHRYFAVFGKRFDTRAEAVAYADERIRLREAAAGRELTREELRNGIAKEDRPLRERVAVESQQQHGFRDRNSKPGTGEPNANSVAWGEHALEQARFGGNMSDVVAAENQLAAAQAGAPPLNPAHQFMLPGDRVTRQSDGRGNSEIVVLRKQDKYDTVVQRWDAESAPAEIKSLTQKEMPNV